MPSELSKCAKSFWLNKFCSKFKFDFKFYKIIENNVKDMTSFNTSLNSTLKEILGVEQIFGSFMHLKGLNHYDPQLDISKAWTYWSHRRAHN